MEVFGKAEKEEEKRWHEKGDRGGGKLVSPPSHLSALEASSFSAQGAGTGNRG